MFGESHFIDRLIPSTKCENWALPWARFIVRHHYQFSVIRFRRNKTGKVGTSITIQCSHLFRFNLIICNHCRNALRLTYTFWQYFPLPRCVRATVYIQTHAYRHINNRTHTHTYTYMHMRIHICARTYTHANTHTHMHARTYIHTNSFVIEM